VSDQLSSVSLVRLLISTHGDSYNLIGEERKKLPTKIDLDTEQGTEVLSEVVYRDGVSLLIPYVSATLRR
jgi:hypothetical protein